MQQEDRLQPISKRPQASIINFQIKARNCNTQKRGGGALASDIKLLSEGGFSGTAYTNL